VERGAIGRSAPRIRRSSLSHPQDERHSGQRLRLVTTAAGTAIALEVSAVNDKAAARRGG